MKGNVLWWWWMKGEQKVWWNLVDEKHFSTRRCVLCVNSSLSADHRLQGSILWYYIYVCHQTWRWWWKKNTRITRVDRSKLHLVEPPCHIPCWFWEFYIIKYLLKLFDRRNNDQDQNMTISFSHYSGK
jgi:hypothetical protein